MHFFMEFVNKAWNGMFGVVLKLIGSFLDRVVFLRVGPFYSHISDSCHKSQNLL